MLIRRSGGRKGRVRDVQELDISYEDLTPDQRDIYDCIGAQAYERLVQRYGGLSIYVAKADSVIRSARDEKIRRDFNGYNFKYLANKYNLSERTIRSITAEIRQEKQNAPLEDQLSFDEI